MLDVISHISCVTIFFYLGLKGLANCKGLVMLFVTIDLIKPKPFSNARCWFDFYLSSLMTSLPLSHFLRKQDFQKLCRSTPM